MGHTSYKRATNESRCSTHKKGWERTGRGQDRLAGGAIVPSAKHVPQGGMPNRRGLFATFSGRETRSSVYHDDHHICVSPTSIVARKQFILKPTPTGRYADSLSTFPVLPTTDAPPPLPKIVGRRCVLLAYGRSYALPCRIIFSSTGHRRVCSTQPSTSRWRKSITCHPRG